MLLRQAAGLADSDTHDHASGLCAAALRLEDDFGAAWFVRTRSKINLDRIVLSRRDVIYRVSCFVCPRRR